MEADKKLAKALYNKAYREANKEILLHKNRERYAADRAKFISQSLEHRKRNRDKIDAAHAANPARIMLQSAKVRAKRFGLECAIKQSDITTPTHCPVLGIPLFVSKGKLNPNSPSLDRINNDLGYVPGNVQVISYKANAMKNDATKEQLLKFALWATSSFGMLSKVKGIHRDS